VKVIEKLAPVEILFLEDGSHTLGVVKAADAKRIFIETDSEELVQFLDPEDIIAASCFYHGEKARKSVMCMLFLVRDGGMPLIVLGKSHPATGRLPMVVSAGNVIRLSSCIVPGTHPEQDVLCGRGNMDGLILHGVSGGVEIDCEKVPSVSRRSF
jgi:hypothetical protein